MDVGYTQPKYYDVRAIGLAILRGVLVGDLTPEEAAKKYEDEANEALR